MTLLLFNRQTWPRRRSYNGVMIDQNCFNETHSETSFIRERWKRRDWRGSGSEQRSGISSLTPYESVSDVYVAGESVWAQIMWCKSEQQTQWKNIEWREIACRIVLWTFVRAEGRDKSPYDRDCSKSTLARFAEDWEESGMRAKRENLKHENHGSIRLREVLTTLENTMSPLQGQERQPWREVKLDKSWNK